MKTKYPPREGWWFSAEVKLPHGDERPIVIGQKLSIKGKLVICRNALHGSFDPFDALQYAPGPLLHKCLFSGARVEDNDKLGSRSRTVIATKDATSMLHKFACERALSVVHLWNAPAIVREYLETGEERIRGAAWAAAWAAAWDAARDAARAAAWAATRAAAWDAAWDAARDAARNAAWAAARDAAWDAAWAAAWDAAWDAARDATWAATRKRFNELVVELFAEASDAGA